MSILWPFISAVGAASLVIVDKHLLSKRKLPVREYVPFLFVVIFLLMLPFVLLGLGGEITDFSLNTILLFAVTVFVAVAWNVIYYHSIKAMEVQEFELINLLSPVATALLGFLIFASERNLVSVLASIVALAALVVTHLKRGHLEFSKQVPKLIAAIILIAVESALWMPLLEVASPFIFYFVRCGAIAIVFLFLWKPRFEVVGKHDAWEIIALASVLAVVQMVARMYGFRDVGLIPTMAAFAISPVIVYVFDAIVIKERIKLKNVLTAIVIVTAAIIAQIK